MERCYAHNIVITLLLAVFPSNDGWPSRSSRPYRTQLNGLLNAFSLTGCIMRTYLNANNISQLYKTFHVSAPITAKQIQTNYKGHCFFTVIIQLLSEQTLVICYLRTNYGRYRDNTTDVHFFILLYCSFFTQGGLFPTICRTNGGITPPQVRKRASCSTSFRHTAVSRTATMQTISGPTMTTGRGNTCRYSIKAKNFWRFYVTQTTKRGTTRASGKSIGRTSANFLGYGGGAVTTLKIAAGNNSAPNVIALLVLVRKTRIGGKNVANSRGKMTTECR